MIDVWASPHSAAEAGGEKSIAHASNDAPAAKRKWVRREASIILVVIIAKVTHDFTSFLLRWCLI
jgi:hypothetical protein